MTVRFAWEVASDHFHPEFTFTCVKDLDMAISAAGRAAAMAPRSIRFLGADVSESGGRHGPWEPLALRAELLDRRRLENP